MSKKLYIAYGSNLNMEQMKFRCPDAKPYASGLINGWKLVFRGSKTGSYCSIIKSPEDAVPIGIWEISERDEKNLDVYEGYPRFYRKKFLRLKTAVGEKMAMVYIINESAKPGIPSQHYIDVCRKGYKDFNLPLEVWEQAIEFNRTEIKA